MKATKDNFSTQANEYAKYRPAYPPELYNFLFSLVEDRRTAWDCATGNGQVAMELSSFFEKVYATDISEQQLKNAVQKDNIFYSVERAESSSLEDNSIGLVAVAQAIHWFDFDRFYREVKRVLTPNGVFAIIGYGLLKVNEEVDRIIKDFHDNIVGPYWDKERKYIDENYQTIPFPFEEIAAPKIINRYYWTLEDLTGYLDTWSAVQHYINAKNENPVEVIKPALKKIWPEGTKQEMRFPIMLRVAKMQKQEL
ncbi:MAG: methylase involved in ubiquinone/menaquinone biosynthesis [Ferruginibacter sp.]|nr:methylase involved in ubiquinone/menaquinone biosynthesis [Ferruginibacter sp.]